MSCRRVQNCRRRRGRKQLSALALFSWLILPTSAFADWTLSPFLSAEGALFEDDSTHLTKDQISSLIPGLTLEASGDLISYNAKAAYRFDFLDQKRDLFYIAENYLRWQSEDGNQMLSLGHQRLALGSLDVMQSMDAINDMVADSFSPEVQRRGIPLLSYRHSFDTVTAELYMLPYFEAPYYPANSSRMGYGFEFDQERIINSNNQVGKEGWRGDQFGAKIDWQTDYIDLSFGHFHMIDRGLSIVALDSNNLLTRYFYATDMSFMNFQAVAGEHLFKGNIYYKDYHNNQVLVNDIQTGNPVLRGPQAFTTAALGYETKIPLISNHDTTLILEGQKVLGLENDIARRYSLLANDVSWGIRHSFNDVSSKQITLIHVIDLDHSDEQIFQGDYRQMITDNLKLTFGVRIIKAAKNENFFSFDNLAGLALVDDADCVYLTLTQYF